MPHLEKDLLQHLFALVAVNEHPQDEAEHARRQHVVEPRKGFLLAASGAHQQLAARADAAGDDDVVEAEIVDEEKDDK